MTRFVVDAGALIHVVSADVQVQGDALVTVDADLASRVEGIVATASIDALVRP